MLSENWLEEMLQEKETTEAAIPELQIPTQEELVIREMVLLGEISEEEARRMLNRMP
jgi:polyhydroxyalkanoate synthesis regulator phasin